MAENLTKKQQKALAFRAKQKGKKSGKQEVVPEDVPEQDLVEDNEVEAVAAVSDAAEASKKGKGIDAGKEEKAEGCSKDVKETKGAKAKGKGKAKNAWEEGEEGEGGEDAEGKKSKKEIKQRFILFVGELRARLTLDSDADVQETSVSRRRGRKFKRTSPKRPVRAAPTSEPFILWNSG